MWRWIKERWMRWRLSRLKAKNAALRGELNFQRSTLNAQRSMRRELQGASIFRLQKIARRGPQSRKAAERELNRRLMGNVIRDA